MKPKTLTLLQDWKDLIQASQKKSLLIFKHSTTCSISATAWERLNRNWDEQKIPSESLYYLDILQYRFLSNVIAEETKVTHESPQILIIYNGKSVFSASHLDINFSDLAKEYQVVANIK